MGWLVEKGYWGGGHDLQDLDGCVPCSLYRETARRHTRANPAESFRASGPGCRAFYGSWRAR